MISKRASGWLQVMVLAAGFSLSGCAVQWAREHPLYCLESEKTFVRDALYFGLSIPGGGEVSAGDWKRFETDVVSAAFPQGFTVLDSHGTWRGDNGETVAEPGHIIVILHEDDSRSAAAIRDIADRYRTMFHQEAVLRERSTVCASF